MEDSYKSSGQIISFIAAGKEWIMGYEVKRKKKINRIENDAAWSHFDKGTAEQIKASWANESHTESSSTCCRQLRWIGKVKSQAEEGFSGAGWSLIIMFDFKMQLSSVMLRWTQRWKTLPNHAFSIFFCHICCLFACLFVFRYLCRMIQKARACNFQPNSQSRAF